MTSNKTLNLLAGKPVDWQLSNHLLWRYLVALLLGALLNMPASSLAQPAPADLADRAVSLQLSGPTPQSVVVFTYYFEQGTLVKSSGQRVEVLVDGVPLALEPAYAGIAVQIVPIREQPLEGQLRVNGAVIADASSADGKPLELLLGAIPEQWSLPSPAIKLTAADKAVLASFLEGIQTQDASGLVSKNIQAELDAACLLAAFESLQQNLGELSTQLNLSDSWLAWPGPAGRRILSGPVEFQRGSCSFELATLDGQLVDAELTSALMPELWLTQDIQTAAYEAQAEELAGALFQGTAESSLALFSPKYRDTISTQRLASLAADLKEQFGEQIIKTDLRTARLSSIDTVKMQRILSVVHSYTMDTGKICVSKVDFVIPLSTNRIPRAHLATINVGLAWRSAAPRQVAVASEAMALLGSPDFDVDRFCSLLAPEILQLTNPAELKRRMDSVLPQLGEFDTTPDWDLWTVSTGDGLSHAMGGIVLADGRSAEAWIDFVGDQVSIVTILSPQVAFTTRDCLANQAPFRQTCRSFWQPLLDGNPQAAYAMLSPKLQQQLSLSEFELISASSGLETLGGKASLQLDSLLISDALDREQAATVTCYCVVALPKSEFQPLKCEIALETSGEPRIVDFTSDFSALIPIIPTPQQLGPLDALVSGNVGRVLQITSTQERQDVDRDVLSAFATKLKRVLGSAWSTQDVRLLHQYSIGRRVERLSGRLETDDGLSIPFTIRTEFEKLKSFHFASDRLSSFIDESVLAIWAKQRVQRFMDAWLGGPLQNEVTMARYLDHELQQALGLAKFADLRGRLLEQHGSFSEAVTSEIQLLVKPLQIEILCPVTFRAAKVQMRIKLDLDATSLRISALEIVAK